MPDILTWPGLVLLGIAVGTYGTMIGAGGGFVLVPLLLILYPGKPPEAITSISLAVVFLNAASGTVAYVRQRRIDFLAANCFAVATIPGAIAGALVTSYLPRRLFDATLQVGVVTESVTVSGETSLLQPETSSLGQVVETRKATGERGDDLGVRPTGRDVLQERLERHRLLPLQRLRVRELGGN